MSVVGVLVLVAAAWRLSDLLLLVFAACVLGIAIAAAAAQSERFLRVPPRASVPVAVVLIAAALAGVAWLVGDPLLAQLTKLRDRLPAAADAVTAWLQAQAFGRQLLEPAFALAKSRAFRLPAERVRLLPAALEGRAEVLGVSALARDSI